MPRCYFKDMVIRTIHCRCFFVVALAWVLGLLCQKPAESAAEKGWALNQSSKLAGGHAILITPHALRVENQSSHYVIIGHAPDWQLVLYNPLSRAVFRTSIKGFKGRLAMGSGLFNGNFLEDLPMSKKPQAVDDMFGVKAQHFYVQYRHPNRRSHPLSTSALMLSTRDIVNVNYWVWRGGNLPREAAAILQKVYKLPLAEGIPLRLIGVDSEKHASLELDTSMLKSQMIGDSSFQVPAGLRAVQSEEDVLNDPDRKFRVNRIIENFDDWRDVMDRKGK